MARVTRVRITYRSDGWAWQPLDPQGRIVRGEGASQYSRKASAIRGAKRACGATVRIDIG